MKLIRAFPTALACLLFVGIAGATDHYVASNGIAGGDGNIDNPWDLQTALNQPASVQPGDTIWVRGGVYHAVFGDGFVSRLNGAPINPIIVRNYSGERATIDGRWTDFALAIHGSYTWFWGLEVFDSNPQRTSPNAFQPNAYGVAVYGPGIRCINMIVHDTAQGFSAYDQSPDSEFFGNISYYNGYIGSDRNHGHGIYMQNITGTKVISDNFVGDNADEGLQIYGSGNANVVGFRIIGNTAYNTSSWPTPHYQYNFIIAGGAVRKDIQVLNNHSYFPPEAAGGYFSLSQYTDGQDVIARGNDIVGSYVGLTLEDEAGPFEFTGNKMFVTSPALRQVALTQRAGLALSTYTWDRNTYYGLDQFYQGGANKSFVDWQAATGFDKNSTFTTNAPKGTWIYVQPNRYEGKRANITIYNWDLTPTVAVDLSGILASGDQYVIKDAQNFFGPAVASGTYSGGPVAIPMTGLTKATPVGFATPAHTAPRFGTFVLLPLGEAGPPQPCPCTIWSSSAVPAIVDMGPDVPVELGVKFHADTNGHITGLRFYKSTDNTGTHVANLWSSTGTLLATATFNNETASGWQQVNFSAPVAITANTVYVASYHTNLGHFSMNRNYFATVGVDNPPLHALANGVSSGDGVYVYGITSSFPTNTFQASNYWVDVVLRPN